MANLLGMKLNQHEKSLKFFHLVLKSYDFDKDGVKPLVALRAAEGEADLFSKQCNHSSAIRRYKLILNNVSKIETNKNARRKLGIFLYNF